MDARQLLGRNVRRHREQLGWSQEELAERSGLHRTYVSGVERGVRNPTLTVLLSLAGALSLELEALLRGVK